MQGDERTEDYKTNCSTCVFAEWEEGVQLGCELGRLEHYIAQGKAVPQEEGYYILETVCCACRGEEWLKAQPIDRSAVSIVEEEIQIPVAFVVVSLDDDPSTLENMIRRRVAECANQKVISPREIIVVVKNEDANSQVLYDVIREEAGEIPNLLVRVVNPKYDFGRCLDMGVSHVKAPYYCVVQLEHNIPTNMLSIINDIIHVDMRPVSMIQSRFGGYSGLVVQTLLHKIFGGNKGQPLHEKLEEAAKMQGKEAYILDWEDLWTRQKSPI